MAPVLCFLIVILSASKFKHVSGFGLDAEMWDQQQVQAAVLVKTLTQTSESLAKEIALVSSGVGMLGGLPNASFKTILEQENVLLDAAKIADDERAKILEPIYDRVEQNYRIQAQYVVGQAYTAAINNVNSSMPNSNMDQFEERSKKLVLIGQQQSKIYEILGKDADFNRAYELMNDEPVILNPADLIENLKKIESQLLDFKRTRKMENW